MLGAQSQQPGRTPSADYVRACGASSAARYGLFGVGFELGRLGEVENDRGFSAEYLHPHI